MADGLDATSTMTSGADLSHPNARKVDSRRSSTRFSVDRASAPASQLPCERKPPSRLAGLETGAEAQVTDQEDHHAG